MNYNLFQEEIASEEARLAELLEALEQIDAVRADLIAARDRSAASLAEKRGKWVDAVSPSTIAAKSDAPGSITFKMEIFPQNDEEHPNLPSLARKFLLQKAKLAEYFITAEDNRLPMFRRMVERSPILKGLQDEIRLVAEEKVANQIALVISPKNFNLQISRDEYVNGLVEYLATETGAKREKIALFREDVRVLDEIKQEIRKELGKSDGTQASLPRPYRMQHEINGNKPAPHLG